MIMIRFTIYDSTCTLDDPYNDLETIVKLYLQYSSNDP
jgi:hypothetical protein